MCTTPGKPVRNGFWFGFFTVTTLRSRGFNCGLREGTQIFLTRAGLLTIDD